MEDQEQPQRAAPEIEAAHSILSVRSADKGVAARCGWANSFKHLGCSSFFASCVEGQRWFWQETTGRYFFEAGSRVTFLPQLHIDTVAMEHIRLWSCFHAFPASMLMKDRFMGRVLHGSSFANLQCVILPMPCEFVLHSVWWWPKFSRTDTPTGCKEKRFDFLLVSRVKSQLPWNWLLFDSARCYACYLVLTVCTAQRRCRQMDEPMSWGAAEHRQKERWHRSVREIVWQLLALYNIYYIQMYLDILIIQWFDSWFVDLGKMTEDLRYHRKWLLYYVTRFVHSHWVDRKRSIATEERQ